MLQPLPGHLPSGGCCSEMLQNPVRIWNSALEAGRLRAGNSPRASSSNQSRSLQLRSQEALQMFAHPYMLLGPRLQRVRLRFHPLQLGGVTVGGKLQIIHRFNLFSPQRFSWTWA